jgi:hypothetical protein
MARRGERGRAAPASASRSRRLARPKRRGPVQPCWPQPKTALFHKDGRWGVPAGRTPTTHILKPPTGEFDGISACANGANWQRSSPRPGSGLEPGHPACRDDARSRCGCAPTRRNRRSQPSIDRVSSCRNRGESRSLCRVPDGLNAGYPINIQGSLRNPQFDYLRLNMPLISRSSACGPRKEPYMFYAMLNRHIHWLWPNRAGIHRNRPAKPYAVVKNRSEWGRTLLCEVKSPRSGSSGPVYPAPAGCQALPDV